MVCLSTLYSPRASLVTKHSIWQIPKCSKDACEVGASLNWRERRFEVQRSLAMKGKYFRSVCT